MFLLLPFRHPSIVTSGRTCPPWNRPAGAWERFSKPVMSRFSNQRCIRVPPKRCVPILESVSGLVLNKDFFVGYSPERINPGDKEHRVTSIIKVTSGSTPQAAEFVDALYGTIIRAGTHKVSSIRVAEAAQGSLTSLKNCSVITSRSISMTRGRLR